MTFTNPLQRCTLLICHKNLPTLRLLLLKMKSWKQSNSETVASAVHNSALHWKPVAITEENIWICIHFFFLPNEKDSRKTIVFWGVGGVLLFCFALLRFLHEYFDHYFDCSYSVRPWQTSSIHPNPPPTRSAQTMCHSLSLWRNRDGAMCLQHVSPPHPNTIITCAMESTAESWASVTHMSCLTLKNGYMCILHSYTACIPIIIQSILRILLGFFSIIICLS